MEFNCFRDEDVKLVDFPVNSQIIVKQLLLLA